MRLEIQSTNIKLTETNNRIDIINSEIEAYEKLNKAKASVLTSKTLDPIGKEIAKRMPTFNTKDLGQELIGQGKIKEQLEFAKAAKEVIVNASPADILKSISSSGYIPPNTKKKKEKKPGEVSAKEIADAKIKEINYEVDLDKKKEKTLETQIKMAKEAKDYNKQIELTNQLITTQKKTVTDLNTANKKLHTEADNVRDKSKYKDTEKWFNIAGEESSYYIEKFNKASKSEQESMQKTFTLLQKLKNAYKSNSDEINQYSDALTSTKQSLEDVYKSQKKAYEEWHDKTKEVADKVVDLIKDAYEKQKDLAVAAIEKQMEAEEKRHDKEISNIEETLKKREDATDAQLKLLDKQDDEEEYNKKLTKAQKERQEKLDKISILSMDNSFEAQGQVIDLQKEIAEKDEEIAEIKNDRNKKLRKENLKDELDSYKTEIDKKKKAEDDKYKATKDSLDKQKKDQDLYYTNLINNEVYFQELRTDILNKGTDKAKAKLNEFLNDFKSKNESTVTAIGQSWNSLLSIRQNLEKSITSLDNVNYKPKTDWENGVSNPLGMSNADFATYVGNKGAWESGVNQSTTSSSNKALRDKYGITSDNYSYNDLKKYLPEYDTGGYTGNNDSFPALLHKKELILNQVDTGNILKTVDITRNIVDKINLSGINLKPVVGGNNGSGNGSVVNISSINLNIDKLNGNEQGGKIAFNTIIKELSKQGVRMPSSTY